MGINENKRVVLELARLTSAGKYSETAALMADEVEHWMQGFGMVTKQQVGQIVTRFLSHFKGPLQLDVVGLTAEGDRVAAEIRSRAELLDGQIYENTYHILYRIREGKIFAVREYLDSKYVAEIESIFSAIDAGDGKIPVASARPTLPPLTVITDVGDPE